MNKKMVVRIVVISFLILCIGGFAIWSGREEQASLQSSLVLAAPDDTALREQGYTRASGPAPFMFPEDYGPHPDYQTEWWYYTGNLTSSEGRHFGYQLTFFRRALLPPDSLLIRSSDWATEQAYMAHFALTDVHANQHYAFERLARGSAGIAGAQSDPYKVWLEDWRVELIEPNIYRLYGSQDGVVLDIILTDTKGPIAHGDQGYSQKGPDPGNASYYYSQTRLLSEGSVTINQESFSVNGLSWKDHEYSTSALSEGQIGWDWFSIQLDNNSEIMLFQIRREDGSIDPYSSGSFILADGTVEHLTKEDFELEVLDTWKSPYNGAIYPARWILGIPKHDIRLEIEPHIADQEMNFSYSYWEGAVKVNGIVSGLEATGNGYVEMTGYAGSMSGEF